MAGALMNKVWDLFGMDSQEAEEYDEESVYDYEEEEEIEDRKLFGRKKDKVVAMPQMQGNAIKMVISQPTTFEQSDENDWHSVNPSEYWFSWHSTQSPFEFFPYPILHLSHFPVFLLQLPSHSFGHFKHSFVGFIE